VWSAPQSAAKTPAIPEQWPAVAVDAKGNAVVAFQHAGQLWTNDYTASSNTWGTPVAVDSRDTTSYRPLIAVDKNGAYLIVWQQDPNDTNKGIWWSSSSNGKTWTTPAAITKTVAGGPELSMNAEGAAVVAWPDQDATMNYNDRIMASVRPAAAGAWTAPKVLRDAVNTGGDDPAVAMSGKGEAFVLWVQSDGGAADKYSIWSSQYTNGAWGTAALFETYNGSNAFAPAIAANAAGDAIGVYSQVDASGLTESMWARRYTMGGTFSSPVNVTQGKQIDSYQAPALVLDESRTATVAWPFLIQGKYQVFASRAGAADAWPTATQLETDDDAADDDVNDYSAGATTPALGLDPAGNVTLLWRKRVGKRYDLWTTGFAKSGAAWGTPKKLETTDTDTVDWLSLGVGSDGTAIAVWDYAAELHIWAAIFR
jgi:hypothetical protein